MILLQQVGHDSTALEGIALSQAEYEKAPADGAVGALIRLMVECFESFNLL
jgi:hypothetical protein